MIKKLCLKFALELKALMDENGMTQKELAIKSGLTEASISCYSNGKRLPNQKTMDMFNNIFNVNFDRRNYTKEVEKESLRYSDGIRYQKLMNDGKFDVLERIIEIEKEIISLEEEKRKLLES